MESNTDKVHQELFRRAVCSRIRIQEGILFEQLDRRGNIVEIHKYIGKK